LGWTLVSFLDTLFAFRVPFRRSAIPNPSSYAIRLLAAALCTLAGVATLEAQDAPDTSPQRWKASAELSYSDQSGNRTLRVLTGGFKASHLQKDLFRLDANLQSRYGEADDGVVARNHYGSLAFDLRPNERVSPFVFVDAEHDRFKRLDLRLSSGAGAKYVFYRAPGNRDEASLSLAMLVSHENRVPTANDPRETRTIGRASLRIRGNQQLPSGVRLQHTSFYQPMVDQLADYLLRTESGVRVTLVERLALSVVYQFNRTALPPEGVAPDERLLRTGIIFDF
jgi:putative salt-induced outer membrane protein YdiY